jgi:hypothetical protein
VPLPILILYLIGLEETMFLYIGRQYVNMNNVVTVDEGASGQLRLNLSNGKTTTAMKADEVEQVLGALKQLAYVPTQLIAPAGSVAPSVPTLEPAKAPAKKKVSSE